MTAMKLDRDDVFQGRIMGTAGLVIDDGSMDVRHIFLSLHEHLIQS
ncbi:hypothetical protein HNR44_002742 [Geomicrobium halophilum]|uniref:Uncharacterized protein n=1 Tax=Geomicrobium halophilum TaxID=549000 RepID=A0A841Q080_9BACL|nr:hypothetical protein [Geomicrobium halophilum]MBB6450752.1 hypothetical protein [Geomicrobium halophilum]